MPRVPTYDSPQAAAQNLPGVQAQSVASASTLGQGGAQLERIGQQVVGAGNEFGKIAIDMQNMANQTRVDDALNQARQQALALTFDPQAGYLSLKGSAALDRPDGKALPDEYAGKLQEGITSIADGLGNDAQRRLFALHSNDIVTSFQGDVQKHTLQEFRSYSLSVQDGAIKLGADAAKLNWDNPEKIAPALDSVKAAVYKAGQLNGESANETTARMKVATSAVHVGVIDAAIQNNNPSYASLYLQQNKDGMTADDILKVNGVINHTLDGRIATSAVTATTQQFVPKFQPTDMDRLKGIVLGMESGGKETDAKGNVLTSPKGAKGSMQVLDSTNGNPGFGVTPAQDNSPEERARVGRDYLAAMVGKYGNAAQAMAAYNAGPGALDDALAKAKADGKPENWLAYLPKETQSYVQNGVAKFNSGAGTPARPTELEFVNDAIARLGPNPRPEQLKLTREAAEHQFGIITKSIKEQGENAMMDGMKALIANGGKWDAVDPQLRNAVAQYAPGKLDDILKFAKAISKGDNETNPELYAKLAAYPDEMTKMSDAQFMLLRPQLSEADFKHFAKERGDYLNGKTNDSSESINSKAVTTAVGNRLTSMGINATPKPTDMAGKQQVGTVLKFVRDSIFDQQTQTGRKLTPAEIEEHVDTLFAKNIDFRRTLFGFGAGTITQNMLGMKVSDIPAASLDSLKQEFAKRGVPKPTDDQLLRSYWTVKNRG